MVDYPYGTAELVYVALLTCKSEISREYNFKGVALGNPGKVKECNMECVGFTRIRIYSRNGWHRKFN